MKKKPPLRRGSKSPRKRASLRATPPPARLLAAALRSLGEGVFIAGPKLRRDGLPLLFANGRLCAMTGYAQRELAGRGHAFLHADAVTLVRLRRWLGKLQPGLIFSGEGYLACKSGATIFAAWNFSPLFNARGRITHIVATYRDTTTRRRLQEALVHAQRLDAVGRLAGGVAHDFNNLLSVINGYCEILAARLPIHDPSRREIHEVHSAGQKAAVLVRQLLAFSRRQELHPQVINLNRLVRDRGTILGRFLGSAGKLHLDLSHDLPNVRADPAQLEQVLLNLTLNARDALRENGRVTISTSVRVIKFSLNRRLTDTPPGHYVLLSISDNGIGMDTATQTQIFEPFFTTKDAGKGTGLGLAMVYGVVQQSGGHIQVHSASGVGTTFEILLPAVHARASATSDGLPVLPSTHGRETVLLIEEDDVVRKMVAGILTADGYKVLASRHAREALREARRRGPVHLLVVQLGDQAGENEKLARTLYATQPALRVIGIGRPGTRPLAWLASEYQTCLAKPFELSALLRAIRTLLDTKP
ncbi:MAG TPA: ATP-binding protein [Opitutaceae bacterium]|jgi:two-component system cell cycle sensor histidine kinase/response regulator CckA|nr:ATP-binding protein [Opitutaceae bacterium]